MTRPLFILMFIATCVAGVPFAFFIAAGGGDDSRPAHAKQNDDDGKNGDDRGKSARFGWLKALANTLGDFGGNDDDEANVSARPKLVQLDKMMEAGVMACAPEIFGYDRGLLERLQGNWLVLKPNVRPSWDAWLQKPGVAIDEELLARCNSAFTGDDCSAMADSWEECTRPFKGTLGGSEPCETNEQCASSECVEDACTAPDDCTSMSGCPSGLLCADDGTGFHTCIDPPGEGDGCLDGTGDDDGAPGVDPTCGGDRVCNRDDVCVTARAAGQRCTGVEPCAYELYCDYGDGDDVNGDDEPRGRCVVDEPDGMDGEEVADSDDVDPEDEEEGNDEDEDSGPSCACDPYRDGMACVEDPFHDRMKCVPAEIVDIGDACDDSHLCRGALGLSACIEGKCEKALGVGDACDDHEQCKDDLVCIEGGCASPRRDGQECSESDDCIFGLDCIERDGREVCGITIETTSHDDDGGYDGHINEMIPLDDVIIEGIPPDDVIVDEDNEGDIPPQPWSVDGIEDLQLNEPPASLDDMRELMHRMRITTE